VLFRSHNYFDLENGGNVNITTSLRQPGSTIKIVTYSLALSKGFTEATIIEDAPISIQLPEGVYSPVNYDGAYHGRLPLRYVFANSLNTPAVRVAQKFGVENIVNFGKLMGIKSWGNPKKYGLSITLGAAEVRMTDLATVFGTIANGGERVYLDPVLEIVNAEGEVIYEKQPQRKQAVDPGVAFIVSDILADNNARSIEFGLNSPLNIPAKRVSVKTGTTDDKRDNWTVGFTKDYVVATWVGNNDNTPMSPYLTSGITGAAPMWNKIMLDLLTRQPQNEKEYFSPVNQNYLITIPQNIIKKTCFGREAYFIKGTENSVPCVIITPTPSK